MKKLLIADDDPRLLHALSIRLELEGFEVVASRDGAEAIRAAKEVSPDLVILDVSMPRADGFAVARAVREDTALADVPIIFMTGRSDPEFFDLAMDEHGIAFLSKPFDSNTLLPLIQCAMNSEI
ncbi:MAG: response regulator [Planctomycetes bacterium]|nr:response regulator [Planctomycetota bacterium]